MPRRARAAVRCHRLPATEPELPENALLGVVVAHGNRELLLLHFCFGILQRHLLLRLLLPHLLLLRACIRVHPEQAAAAHYLPERGAALVIREHAQARGKQPLARARLRRLVEPPNMATGAGPMMAAPHCENALHEAAANYSTAVPHGPNIEPIAAPEAALPNAPPIAEPEPGLLVVTPWQSAPIAPESEDCNMPSCCEMGTSRS